MESKRITSMFSNASKRDGGTYYSGKLGGDQAITIQPGQRLTLVKTSKTASNGSEIWSLLVDEAGKPDGNRVYESRRDIDPSSVRGGYGGTGPGQGAARVTILERGIDDEIPF